MTRSDAEENVMRLLRAARDAVAAEGPGVGVRVIADRAEVGVTTLYRHFPTKERLIDGVSLHRWVTMRDLAAYAWAPGEALSRIVLLADTFSRMVSVDDRFIEAAGLRVGRAPAPAIIPTRRQFDAALAPLWLGAQRDGQVRGHADPRDLIELVGCIRDRSRRTSRLRMLLHGICCDPDTADRLLAERSRHRDPGYL